MERIRERCAVRSRPWPPPHFAVPLRCVRKSPLPRAGGGGSRSERGEGHW